MSTHPFPALARAAVELFVCTENTLPLPEPLPSAMQARAAAFVSIHFHDGALRGCIGSVRPIEDNLAREIIRNAIAAATRDPRFAPVTDTELPRLTYSVDVLDEPKPIHSINELNAKRYGVLVEKGWRRGLLLPDLEGVDTAEMQVRIALEKAGIHPRENYKLYRFDVKRYH